MSIFDIVIFTTCFGILLWIVRFSVLAFWPDTSVGQLFQRMGD